MLMRENFWERKLFWGHKSFLWRFKTTLFTTDDVITVFRKMRGNWGWHIDCLRACPQELHEWYVLYVDVKYLGEIISQGQIKIKTFNLANHIRT